jgi:hypothetical protein
LDGSRATQPDAKKTASQNSWNVANFFTAAPARWKS